MGYETFEWAPSQISRSGISDRAWRKHVDGLSGTYQSAIPASIAELDYVPSGDVRARTEEAQHEIARFDAEMGSEIAPFSSILLRTEASASSNIENLSSSAKAIELALLGDRRRGTASLIAQNTQAMRAAIGLSDVLEPDSILRMHDALLRESAPSIAGKWRDCPVWIGTSSRTPIGADFVAPHHDRVPGAIADLVTYLQRRDVPTLEHTAIAHAQFETIHPFADGNGRVGRALMHVVLRNRGLTRHVTVPVSAGLLADVTGYHDALTDYRAGDPDTIVGLSATASLRAIDNGRQLIADLREIREGWQSKLTARRDSAVWRVADLLMRQPVLTVDLLTSELGIDARHAHRYLTPLEERGVLRKAKLTKRESYWAASEVLDALDRFSERAGRRTAG